MPISDRLRALDLGGLLVRRRRWFGAAALFGVGWALGAWIDATLARSLWRGMPPQPPPQVARVAPPTPERRAYSEFRPVLDANLFRVDVERMQSSVTDAAGEVTAEPTVTASPLPAEVIGTLAGRDEVAAALIRDKRNQEVDVYRVGDNLFGMAIILKILRGEILVLRGNQQESLKFDEGPDTIPLPPPAEALPSPSVTPAPVVEERMASDLVVRELSPNEFVIDKDSFDNVMKDLGPLLTQARVVPNFRKGKIEGYKIFAIKDGSLFQEIGMQNGDVIHAVNGVAVDTPERALQLFQQLRSETDFIIDIERDGARRAFHYRLQ